MTRKNGNGNGNADVYQRVTDTITAALDRGTIPWRQPWASLGRPMSVSTGKAYRGLNTLLLTMTTHAAAYDSRFYGTYRKLNEIGGQVRKGERGSLVTFWKMLERKDADAGPEDKPKRVPMLRAYTVFNVEQCQWLNDETPERFRPVRTEHVSAPDGMAPVAAYLASGPALRHGGDGAFYEPSADRVTMPLPGAFQAPEGYFHTLYHELAHSTGHASRLNREGLRAVRFGSPVYSREELIAELASAMVSAVTGIETPSLLDDAAAYIAGWRRFLADDPRAVVVAAGKAQRAADAVLGVFSPSDQAEGTTATETPSGPTQAVLVDAVKVGL